MRLFSHRKIRFLIQFILLIMLVVVMLTLVLNSMSNSHQMSYPTQIIQQMETSTILKNGELSLSSACLSRNILDSRDVQLYSNRLKNKKYYLTIGIPTIARKIGHQYLMKTLHSLSTNQSYPGKNKPDILIVVQLGDFDKNKRTTLATEIKKKYTNLINDGILDIIQVYAGFYPSFDKLKQRFGDSEMRVKWRSKQAIDFSFLSCYCYGLGKYHLQLEDDVIASPYYFLKLKDFIESYDAKKNWFTLDASVLGYIGKVYHNYDLNEIASFYYIFFDEMPVDWMEYTWREIKGQTGRWRFRVASLFQHIGVVSSLQKKNQVAEEPYFDNQTQKFLGLNPPAVAIQTDLIAEHKTHIKSVYQQGGGYFWGRCHKSFCFIKVIFEKPLQLQRVVLETGGNFGLNDTIKDGSLQLGTYPNTNDCVHYVTTTLGRFKKGTLDIVFSEVKEVNCLRVEIKTQKEWILIREINVWPGKKIKET